MTIVFGGSFNPPHKGHIEIAEHLSNEFKDAKIMIVPSFLSPHKDGAKVSFFDRINMCKIAFSHIKNLEVSDIEEKLGGKSYTINTINALIKDNFPIYLVIGADMAESFNTWKDALGIAKKVKLLVYSRNDKLDTKALEKLKADFKIMNFKTTNISSTKLRENLNKEFIKPEVLDYIKSHSLYGYEEKYKKILKENLKEKRYNHCLNVALSAKELAIKNGADINKAYTAGLLHDITKEMTCDKQLKLIDNFGIIMTELELKTQKLWHAITGAYYIKEILNINDEEIFDAVRFHTTAKANMSLISKIVYIADYISSDRDYNGVNEMRAAAKKSLDEAMLIATEFTINDLKSEGKEIHPDTILAYKECKRNL